LAFCLWVFWN